MNNDQIGTAADVQAGLELELSGERRRRGRSWAVIIVVALGVAIALGVWLMRGRTASVHYVSQPVERGDLVVTVGATGTLQPTNRVEISTEISGRVERVAVDYNDTVKAGQVLAHLDTSHLQASVAQSRAALAAAESNVLEAQASLREAGLQLNRLTRMRELSGGTLPSQSDVDAAQAAADRASATLASARATVKQNRATLQVQTTELAKADIRSPIDGVVLERSVEPGQTVAATLQAPVLFVLAESLTQMELHVDVDEADVSSVRTGQNATFTVDAFPNRRFSAQVSEVHFGAKTVSGVVTYETVLNVDNSALELRPGMTATAAIVVDQVGDAILVPNAALRFQPPQEQGTTATPRGSLVNRLMPRPPGRQQQPQRSPTEASPSRTVWRRQNGEPVAVPVTVGASDGQRTQVLSGGLEPGMAVIVDVATAAP